jgi:hypothetical protein
VKLREVVEAYIAFKRALGVRLESEARALRAFCRGVGDTDVQDVKPTAVLTMSYKPPVAECSHPSQRGSTGAVGATYPTLEPMDSPTQRPTSLSRLALQRHSSIVRAACVNTPTRPGGAQ